LIKWLILDLSIVSGNYQRVTRMYFIDFTRVN